MPETELYQCDAAKRGMCCLGNIDRASCIHKNPHPWLSTLGVHNCHSTKFWCFWSRDAAQTVKCERV